MGSKTVRSLLVALALVLSRATGALTQSPDAKARAAARDKNRGRASSLHLKGDKLQLPVSFHLQSDGGA